jgi:hypothetical protein
MFTRQILAIVSLTAACGCLIPLGIVDSSVIPLPGSMDVLTILLAARNSQLWFYYVVIATLGLHVCSTLKKPISAPRCLGLRATSRRVSALVRNKRA